MSSPLAQLVYVLCAGTSLLSAYLLWHGYRQSRYPLLFWGSLCFLGLALNNTLVFIDLVMLPQVDLAALRTTPAVLGLGAMVFGLIREAV